MSEASQPGELPRLLALTPEYQPDNHRIYLEAVEAALGAEKARGVRNIALTGSYGTGKSSVLQQVAKVHKKRVIQVSLSTLGTDDAEPDSSAAQSKTNRIQKEIVKQFLYREDPAKSPGSRFRRISRLNFKREFAAALLMGLVIALVFLLAGWSEKLIDLANPYMPGSVEPHLPLALAAGIWLLSSGFMLALRYLTHHRLRIEKVTAGPATISLTDDSASFFDRYLDEIVYFFDVTKYDIVIFEDIDRFDDPHIFETLRALNTLLNGARQLKGRSIRFVYAIKDSIFDELGMRAAREEGAKPLTNSTSVDAADAELARANRTKFFDLVIPVVPFITHLSARDVVGEVMKGIHHEVSNDLIDLAARHIADMRFVKNVRNEFVIFREKVLPRTNTASEIVQAGQRDLGLKLSENSLFAMMLYKGTHLSDFEAIRLGTSKLDELYKASRDLVNENVSRLDAEARSLRRRIALPDSVEARSKRLGTSLAEYIERSARQVRVGRRSTPSISLGGQPLTVEALQTVDFWIRFVADDSPLTVSVPGFQPPGWGNIFNVEIDIIRSDAAKALGEPLSLDHWRAEDQSKLPRRLDEVLRERDFLLHADMGELIARRDLTVSHNGSQLTLDDLSEALLGSALAQKLVAAGYINRDFTLYSSTYYGERVSTRARNFLMHNIDPNIADFHFVLEPQDVDAILRERDDAVLRERGSYNIAILDRLLASKDNRVDLQVGALITFGASEREFLQSYLAGGQHAVALIDRMTSRSPKVFKYLISEAEVDEELRAKLIGAALLNINPEVVYEVNPEVREYFEANYTSLTPIVEPEIDEQSAKNIANLLVSMDAHLGTLSPVGPEVLKAVVAKNRYVLTRENLMVALGDGASLSLDAIRRSSEIIYARALADIQDYLAVLDDHEYILETSDAFVGIIEDLVEHAEGNLEIAVHRASEECVVGNVKDVAAVAWPTLARHARFPANFSNITTYISEFGRIDDDLWLLLSRSRRILGVPSDEDVKQVLASQILSPDVENASPDLRTELVFGLDLKDFVPPTVVPQESGSLLGLLLKYQLIEDNSTSFALALNQDWCTREYAISQSTEFPRFMTPTEVPVGDVANLLRSKMIPPQVKQNIIASVSDYTASGDRSVFQAVAEYALSNGLQLPLAEVARHASAGLPPQLIIRMLHPHLGTINLDQLTPILRSLPEPYPTISDRNGRHPKLPNTAENVALVQTLKELGIVSSYNVNHDLAVNMRKSTDQ